jgi:cell wall-associated NlpC family hydrolase
VTWTQRYVGIPYADDGRTGGYHCWSLVRTVLREEAGIDVPDYGETSAADLAAVALAMARDAVNDPWVKVDVPRALDVVVMAGRPRVNGARRRLPIHVGIMVDSVRMLHVDADNAHCVQVSLSHPSVKFRIVSFQRHKALANV